MHKNALFLFKSYKNRPALGAPPPDPRQTLPPPIEKSYATAAENNLASSFVVS